MIVGEVATGGDISEAFAADADEAVHNEDPLRVFTTVLICNKCKIRTGLYH